MRYLIIFFQPIVVFVSNTTTKAAILMTQAKIYDRSATARGTAVQEVIYEAFSRKELNLIVNKYGNQDIESRLASSKLNERQKELQLSLSDPDLNKKELHEFRLGIDKFANQKEIKLYPKYIEKPLIDHFRSWNKRIDCIAEKDSKRFILEITSTRKYKNFETKYEGKEHSRLDSKLKQAYEYLLMANELWNLNLQGVLVVVFLPGNGLYETEERSISKLEDLFPQTKELVLS